MIAICHAGCSYEREPLRSPFGFKGRAVTELWQTVAGLRDDHGRLAVGVGTQSPLWSDAEIFSQHGETDSNRLMYQLTGHALELCRGRNVPGPGELFDELFPAVLAFGRALSASPQLRSTFALNALVAVDQAAWQLHAAGRGTTSFEAVTAGCGRPFDCRHATLAAIPAIGYADEPRDAAKLADAGSFVLKIKIGCDPGHDGDRKKMLAWDCARIAAIHAAVGDRETPHTKTGRIAYYLDANGRYDNRVRVLRLLEHCERIGALPHIILLEEPFPERDRTDVRDLPVRLAADESAASVEDTIARIDLGYRAIALKPAAKTLTMTLRIAAAAHARGIPCFCADLTANPVLLEWAKNIAARLAPLPGLHTAALETNGAQHYRDWARLQSHHPSAGASWIAETRGLFSLEPDFYASSGGIFGVSPHYAALVAAKLNGSFSPSLLS